jgi:hypothetical protein
VPVGVQGETIGIKAGPAGGPRPPSAGRPIDGRYWLAEHSDMRRMNRRLAVLMDAYPMPVAIAQGLAAGVLALLAVRLLFGQWSWLPLIMAAVVAGASSYTGARWRRQERERLERRRQQPG